MDNVSGRFTDEVLRQAWDTILQLVFLWWRWGVVKRTTFNKMLALIVLHPLMHARLHTYTHTYQHKLIKTHHIIYS